MQKIIGKRLGGLMLVNLEIRGEIKIENVELRTGLIVFLSALSVTLFSNMNLTKFLYKNN